MSTGFDVGTHKTGSIVPCYPCNKRPFLSNVASSAQRNATLQSELLVIVSSELPLTSAVKIITIGDCSKLEARAFYERRLVPRVPETMRRGLDFERLYDAFGGRLVHWQDYIIDYGANVFYADNILHAHCVIQ